MRMTYFPPLLTSLKYYQHFWYQNIAFPNKESTTTCWTENFSILLGDMFVKERFIPVVNVLFVNIYQKEVNFQSPSQQKKMKRPGKDLLPAKIKHKE